jgi:hypothetical protein
MRGLKVSIAVLTVLLLLCPAAFAEYEAKTSADAATSPAKEWEFQLAPMYLWAISISGDQTLKGNTVDMDVSFSEIFDNLNGALIVHFEGLKNKQWGFFVDLNWINLNPKESTPLGEIDIDFTEILLELAGFYRFSSNGPHKFDVLGGIRYSSMDVELDFPGPPPSVDDRQDWVDPFIGVRWLWSMAEKWELTLRGDIGGFGIGSDFTANAAGLIDYQPWKHVSLFVGYRALYQDYEDGSGAEKFAFDATMQGPGVGLNIKW